MDKFIIWAMLQIATGFLPPGYRMVIRSAGRVMCLSPFYPDQGQLLNNTFRETLKVTTRQTIITFIATKLMGKQVGAMDLWMTKCLGIEILGQ